MIYFVDGKNITILCALEAIKIAILLIFYKETQHLIIFKQNDKRNARLVPFSRYMDTEIGVKWRKIGQN